MGDDVRETARDRAAVAEALEAPEHLLAEGETAELHMDAGQAARLLGDGELAIRHLRRAADRLVEAERELCGAPAESQTVDDQHDALQHLGKTLADAGRREAAAAALERALALRKAAGALELAASTESALERLRGQPELG